MCKVSCVAAVVLCQINDVNKLSTLMDTQEHVESKAYQLGTDRKSTPLASRTSETAVPCQHSHTKSGEVCLKVKQRALPLSFKLAKNIKHIGTTITFRNSICRKAVSSCIKKTRTSICVVDGTTR